MTKQQKYNKEGQTLYFTCHSRCAPQYACTESNYKGISERVNTCLIHNISGKSLGFSKEWYTHFPHQLLTVSLWPRGVDICLYSQLGKEKQKNVIQWENQNSLNENSLCRQLWTRFSITLSVVQNI